MQRSCRWLPYFSCCLLLYLGGCGVPSAVPPPTAAEPARVQAAVRDAATQATPRGPATVTRGLTPGTPTRLASAPSPSRAVSPTAPSTTTVRTATPPEPIGTASRTVNPTRGAIGPTRTATRPTPTIVRASPGRTTLARPFVDDFTDPLSGWDINAFHGVYGDNTSLYQPDGYHLTVGIADTYNSSDNILIGDVRDVVIEVDVTKLVGDDNRRAGFGVHCRYYNPKNFYVFRLFGYGGYGVYRMQDGIEYRLAGSAGVAHPAILPGDATNHLRAECSGDTLTLTVNGDLLYEGVDSAPMLTPGRVALFACGCGGSTLDALFRNFRATAPAAGPRVAP